MISRTLRPSLAHGPWPLRCHLASSISPRHVYLEKASPCAPVPPGPAAHGRDRQASSSTPDSRAAERRPPASRPSRTFRGLVAGPLSCSEHLRPRGFCRHGLEPMPRALPNGRRAGGSLGPVLEVLRDGGGSSSAGPVPRGADLSLRRHVAAGELATELRGCLCAMGLGNEELCAGPAAVAPGPVRRGSPTAQHPAT